MVDILHFDDDDENDDSWTKNMVLLSTRHSNVNACD